MDEFRIETDSNPDPKDIKFLDDQIFEHGFSEIGPYRYKKLALFIRDNHLRVIAGLYGHTGLDWLYIDVLWVARAFRSKGLGSRLVKTAETEAMHRGCHDVYLYTYSFQRPDFYKRLGYQVFGQLDNFPDGHTKYFLKKSLNRQSSPCC